MEWLHMTSKENSKVSLSQIIILTAATALFLAVLYFLPENIGWPERATISIMVYGLILWAFAPIPIGLTSMVVLSLLILLRLVEKRTALSGIAYPVEFLFIEGMMMSICFNHTLFFG